jgi:hypothetical protein
VRSKNRFLKAAWLIFFLFCLAYAVYTTICLVLSFAEFGVLIKFVHKQEFSTLVFPTITICPLNPFDFSSKSNLDQVFAIYDQAKTLGEFYYINGNRSLCSTGLKEKIFESLPSIVNISQYSMSLDKLVITCSYNNEPCDMSKQFVPMYTRHFGLCYKFNSDGELRVKRTGMINGLEMEMFIGENEYQPCWIANRGLLVAIHNKEVVPALAEDGNDMK